MEVDADLVLHGIGELDVDVVVDVDVDVDV